MSVFEHHQPLLFSQTQLPVASYFDEKTFQLEQQTLFAHMPQFIGHASYVPTVGSYHALAQENAGRVLIRQADGSIALISNVCRHRQAQLLQGSGQLPLSNTVVCPLHRWTYASNGQLLGAPEFEQNPCLHLKHYPIHEWNGLLFTGNAISKDILASLGANSDLDFSDYALGHTEQHHCAYNWKTFMEVYLEDYHVASSHPGLGQFVDCNSLHWTFGKHFSVQTVGLNKDYKNHGTPVYKTWLQSLENTLPGPPKQGAVWLSLYPGLMIEWYPNVLTVSILHPISAQETLNTVLFFYPKDVLDFEPDLCKHQRDAYMETCLEDDDFALRMDAGRKALWLRGENEVGPYQLPLEEGMVHFHEWYRQNIGTTLVKA